MPQKHFGFDWVCIGEFTLEMCFVRIKNSFVDKCRVKNRVVNISVNHMEKIDLLS